MSVRLVRLRHPSPSERVDGPQEMVLYFETVYQLEDRLIAVDPVGDKHQQQGPRQFTRRFVMEIDFDHLTLIPYQDMVGEIGGDIEALDAADRVVERLS